MQASILKFLTRLMILALLVICGCENMDHADHTSLPLFLMDPESPEASPKAVASYHFFKGMDEVGYVEGMGNPRNVDIYLKVVSARLAALMQDKRLRIALLARIHQAENKQVNLADLVLESQRIMDNLSNGFKGEIDDKGVSGKSGTEVIGGDTNADAPVEIPHALFGLQVRLVVPGTGNWNTYKAMPVFHSPTTEEALMDYYEGFNPDGTPVKLDFHIAEAPYPFLYLNQEEEFFRKAENRPKPRSGGKVGMREHPAPLKHRHSLLFLLPDLFLRPAVYADNTQHNAGQMEKYCVWERYYPSPLPG